MIIDSSALLAILLNESEAWSFAKAISNDSQRLISAGTFLEASIKMEALHGNEGPRDLDAIIAKLKIEIVDFTSEHALTGRRAFRKYGKGRHAAGLNFGDCFAYALAKDTGEPLLFKGTDFSKTDITPVNIEHGKTGS
jgi:ribonuclease VapC